MKKLFILTLLGMFIFSGMVLAQDPEVQGDDIVKLPPKIKNIRTENQCKNGFRVIKFDIYDRSKNEENFEIERMVKSGGFKYLMTIAGAFGEGNVITVTDFSAPAGYKIHYKVRGVAKNLKPSGWSNELHITTITCPDDKNILPNADCDVYLVEGYAPFSTHFSGARSSDPDGRIVKYEWFFGDGQEGEGMEIDHVYMKPGKYKTALVVTDNDGGQDIDQCCTITVYDDPPVPPECDVNPVSVKKILQIYKDENGRKKYQIRLIWKIESPLSDGYWTIAKTIYPAIAYDEFGPTDEFKEMFSRTKAKKLFPGKEKKNTYTDKRVFKDSHVFYELRWICESSCGRNFGPIYIHVPSKVIGAGTDKERSGERK